MSWVSGGVALDSPRLELIDPICPLSCINGLSAMVDLLADTVCQKFCLLFVDFLGTNLFCMGVISLVHS